MNQSGEGVPPARFYEIGNDPSFDSIYPYLFSHPGIVILKDFPLTESRFRVLRESFSYEEIVEELDYCIGSRESAGQLAWFIKDDLFTQDAFFLYPEVIRVVLEASIATIVHSRDIREHLALMYPNQTVFHIPDEDYGEVIKAYEFLRKVWKDPRSHFPHHLRPLTLRVQNEVRKKFQYDIPSVLQELKLFL